MQVYGERRAATTATTLVAAASNAFTFTDALEESTLCTYRAVPLKSSMGTAKGSED